MFKRALIVFCSLLWTACSTASPQPVEVFDLILRGGTVYDGRGGAPYVADMGVRGDRVVCVGDLSRAQADISIDARGRAVAPGFINVLSWAPESLIADGRSQGDIRQGVTLEIFGKGWSMGPLNEEMKAEEIKQQDDIKYAIEWTTLSEYLHWIASRGISTNVASLVGAVTVRIHELGYANKPPTAEQLERLKALVWHRCLHISRARAVSCRSS